MNPSENTLKGKVFLKRLYFSPTDICNFPPVFVGYVDEHHWNPYLMKFCVFVAIIMT